jgi:hypothetical protein
MVETLPGWTPEVERSFKEVLFRFLEEVHCTKAALYLLAPDGSYALVAQYGFGRRDQLSVEHHTQDPVVLKVRELRNKPMMVNHPKELPEFAEHLREAGTNRMLLVPLYGASRALGFVDARDKGGQRPFEAGDLRRGAIIGGAFLDLLQRYGLFPDLGVEDAAPAEPLLRQPLGLDTPTGEALLDESGLRELSETVVDTVAREAVFAVAVTVATPDTAATIVYSGARADDVDAEAINRHQAEALGRSRVTAPHHSSWKLDVRRVPAASDTFRASVIATTVPLHTDDWALTLSVVGSEGGVAPATVLERLRRVATSAHEMTALKFSRRGLARRLLEPGEHKYPDLVAHSLSVSRTCWMMAQALEFHDRAGEEAVLVGLLHDVGMRELDYDRLYRHRAPSPDDRRTYQQHVVVGERILRGIGMDPIAHAIRHHHERWDGQGYPDQLAGESIPLLARLVHVAEVFDVLTSSSSYRSPVPVEQALVTMKTAAGQQFDTNLVQVLSQVVR